MSAPAIAQVPYNVTVGEQNQQGVIEWLPGGAYGHMPAVERDEIIATHIDREGTTLSLDGSSIIYRRHWVGNPHSYVRMHWPTTEQDNDMNRP